MRIPFLVLSVISMVVSGCSTGPSSPQAPTAAVLTQTATPALLLPTSSSTAAVGNTQPMETNTPIAIETLDARAQYLMRVRASDAIRFFLDVRDAVQSNDKAAFAAMVLYPIGVHIAGERLIVQGPDEFIDKYDAIITQGWREKILAQDPTRLFSNWQGFMAGRGQLWFGPICLDTKCEHTKWYIIAVNPDF